MLDLHFFDYFGSQVVLDRAVMLLVPPCGQLGGSFSEGMGGCLDLS